MEKPTRRKIIIGCGLSTAILVSGCSTAETPVSLEADGQERKNETHRSETPTPKAQSQEEVEELLPRYETNSKTKRENRERAKEIKNAIWDALDGYDWLVSAGLTLGGNDDWVIVVSSENVSEASRLLPETWEGIPISVEETSGEVELN